MKFKPLVIGLAAAILLAAGSYGLYALGMKRGIEMHASDTAASGTTVSKKDASVDPSTGKKVLYWHDPMVPGQKFDKPGKSPFMDMDLVPVYADEAGAEGTVTIDPRMQQSLGVRVAEVVRRPLAPKVEAVGSIAFNERDQAVVQARATGYVEHLYVRATLDRVGKGQPLADLYVPDWIAAQEEFLSVRRMQGTDLAVLVDGARQRMRQVGMSDEQILLVETSGKVQPRITLVAPVGGVVVELMAREGMTVMPGATLFRINGLSTVWVNAEVPERQAGLLRQGATVEARVAAYAGEVFKGKVAVLLPEVNPVTRTLKARIELSNPKGILMPGMFATVDFTPAAMKKDALLVPTEALIHTGQRDVVILALEGGKFQPVEVEPGIDAEGMTEIRKGLEAGQKVVASSQFLIDSEANLKATVSRMEGAPQATAPQTGKHRGEGVVEAIDKDKVTLSHGPIPSMNWGAMTMGFKLPKSGLPQDIRIGERVAFEFSANQKGEFEFLSITPLTPDSRKAAPKEGAQR